jgi:fused signal recognition particle receptor
MFRALYERLKSGLARTRDLFSGIAGLFTGKGRVDRNFLAEMEKRLLLADVGATATREIVKQVEAAFLDKEIGDDLSGFVRGLLLEMLTGEGLELGKSTSGPTVILVAGVNGSGKTTSIAKLANRFCKEGKTVVVGACDTFRAAAADQLAIWAERSGAELIRQHENADPAAVVFDAIHAAKARGADLVLVDTAGRLHTRTNLMEELAKIRRVCERELGRAPDEVLLALDATTGQNAVTQAKEFTQAAGVTGIVLAKLDGTARGGIVVTLREELGIPVKLVGVGEKPGDLREFHPDLFVQAMLS